MAKTNNKDVHRGVVLYLDGKEVANNAKAIRAEMKKVREQIDKMTVGSEEYVRATRKYRELDKILQQHKAQLKAVEAQQQSMLSKGVKWFKDYSLQIAGAVTAITGVAMQINRFRKMAAEQEDAAANLKALTGLDDDSIAWLTKQAETLSTSMDATKLRVRKSAKEILEAYMLVGSAKPELLKDKEALNAVTIEAMRLAEAANMDLREAVNAVTTSLNQYSAGADQAARITNVLAAGSKFGAANVQDQAAAVQKAGVAASSANVPFEQLVGVIEMLGEKGIKAEESGTALKRFFLKLQTDADDTNPAIVGLDKALENLAAKHLSMGELQKMFGDRAINVAKILIDNTEKVKEYTAAVTDTNVATEQAAINSDTTAAKMAQIRNQINLTGQQLAKDLAPFLSKTVGWTRKFVMVLPVIIEYLKAYGATTAVLVTSLVLYNTYATIASKATAAWNAVVAFARTQANGFTASMAAYRTALTGSTTAHIEMTAAVRGTNIVTQAGVVVVGLLKAAYYALSLQMTMCARTLKMVKVALAESGIGLAVLAIGAAVAAIVHHNEKMKEARRLAEEQRQAERALYKEYNEAAARIRILRKEAEDNNKSLEERRKAIEELQKLAPDYQASISEEGKLIEKNKEKLDEYLERLKASIILESYKVKMTELLQKQMEAEEDQRAASDNYWKKRQENTLQGWNRKGATAGILRFFGLDVEENARKAKAAADKVLGDIDREIEDTEQRMKELAEKWNFSLVDENKGGGNGATDGGGSGDGGGEKDADRQKRIREAIEAVNLEYDARANDLKQKYIDGQIATEEEYGKQLQALELERLNRQLEIAGLEPEKREQIRGKILDMTIKLREQLEQQEEKLKQDAEKAATERLNLSRQTLQDALTEMRRTKIEEGLTEEEYAQRVLEIRRAFYRKALEDQSLSDEKRHQLQREANELEITEEERKQKKLNELAQQQEDRQRQLFDALRSAGEEFGEALGEWLTDTEVTFKEFSKDLLKIVVKTVKNIIVAAIVQRTVDNIRTLGFWGVAKAAGEIALIEAAGAALTGLIENFYTGGYTGQGRWDEPRGIVHAGEFVANRYAVANDAVRPVLDLIDQAQKNGSITNLTSEDIAAVAYPSGATAPSPNRTGTPAAGNNPARDPELTKAINLLTRTTARAAEAYQEPSTAFCFLDGRGGINTAQDLLKKMKSNASRKS